MKINNCTHCHGTGQSWEKFYHNQVELTTCPACGGKQSQNTIKEMGILEQLLHEITAMKAELSELKTMVNKKDPNELLTSKQICEELNISQNKLYRLYNEMPFLMRVGVHIKARRSDLEKYLSERKITMS